MTVKLTIDFVSDVSCPWCVIGLRGLEQALARLEGEVSADIAFRAFELNPHMAPEGQDLYEHMQQKYGSTREQSDSNRAMLGARGEEAGFHFDLERLARIYNTFDAHRLLHLAGLEGCQYALKNALFEAYFQQGANPGDHDTLLRLGVAAGLDEERVRELLASDEFAAEVRAEEQFYQQHGIHAVPAVIINQQHLIQGGQPAAVFEQALRQLAAAEPT